MILAESPTVLLVTGNEYEPCSDLEAVGEPLGTVEADGWGDGSIILMLDVLVGVGIGHLEHAWKGPVPSVGEQKLKGT